MYRITLNAMQPRSKFKEGTRSLAGLTILPVNQLTRSKNGYELHSFALIKEMTEWIT